MHNGSKKDVFIVTAHFSTFHEVSVRVHEILLFKNLKDIFRLLS